MRRAHVAPFLRLGILTGRALARVRPRPFTADSHASAPPARVGPFAGCLQYPDKRMVVSYGKGKCYTPAGVLCALDCACVMGVDARDSRVYESIP